MAGGALVGALAAAGRQRPTPKLLIGTALIFGVSSIGAGLAPSMLWELIVLPVAGGSGMAFLATVNSTMQLGSPDALRGRVMALYGMVFLGSTPIGAPLIGWISGHFGARVGLLIGAIPSLIAALIAWGARDPRFNKRARIVDPTDAPPLEIEPLLVTPPRVGERSTA
jgi:MFS family permease